MKTKNLIFVISLLLMVVIWTSCNKDEGSDLVSVTAMEFSISIDENPGSGFSLGIVDAKSSDGTALSYSLGDQSVSGALSINSSSGELTIARPAAFDFEIHPEITAKYLAQTSTAMDSALITITINDLEDGASLFAEDFSVTIQENPANGQLIGTVTATISNQDDLTYSLTNDGSGALAINGTNGQLTVANPTAFDFEQRQSITGTYQVTNGDLTSTASINVTITDVDEGTQSVITANDFTANVNENPANGFVIGTVDASIDNGNTLSYSIDSESHIGAVSINVNTGLLAVANPAVFDYETNESITGTYEVTDGEVTATGNFTLSVVNVDESFWNTVGTAGFSNGSASFVNMSFNNGVPVVVYRDNGNSNRAQAMTYSGGQWVNHSNPISAGQADYIDFIFWGSNEVVAYRDMENGEKLTVKISDGGSGWNTLGTEGFSAGKASYPSMASANGNLYVAYLEEPSIQTIVKKYNSTTDTWEDVGTQPASGSGFSYNPVLAIDYTTGFPYIAYSDGGHQIHVKAFGNTNSWVEVGTGPSGNYPKIAFDIDGKVFLAYRDLNQSNRLSVRSFDGSSWVLHGNAGSVSDGLASEIDLVVNQRTPIIAYRDSSNGGGYSFGSNGATVMRWDGSSWKVLGTKGFGNVSYTSLAVFNGYVYLAYSDSDVGSGKVTVKVLIEE